MTCSFFLFHNTGSIKFWSLHQVVRILNFEKKTKQTKQKNKKNLWLCFWLNEECPKLLSSLGIYHRRRKTIPLWNSAGEKRVLQGITVCLVSTILGTVWILVDFKLWARIGYRFFLQTQRQNVSYGIGAGTTYPYWPQEMATQAYQASRRYCLCLAISCRSNGLLSSELSLCN